MRGEGYRMLVPLGVMSVVLMVWMLCMDGVLAQGGPVWNGGLVVDLRVLAMFLSHVGEERVGAFCSYMDRTVHEAGYSVPWYIINSTRVNGTHQLAPPDRYRELQANATVNEISRQLIANWLFGIDFALAQPVVPRWIYRGTTDAFVNLRELPGWIDELERELDPIRQWAFIGNAVWGYGRCYPQGGSGYLLSVFAARAVRMFIPKLMRACEKVDDVYMDNDDLVLGRWLGSGEAPGGLTATPRMIGHGFERRSTLRVCPVASRNASRCGCALSQARRVVVWHRHRGGELAFERLRKEAIDVFAADPSVYLYYDGEGLLPELCRLSS